MGGKKCHKALIYTIAAFFCLLLCTVYLGLCFESFDSEDVFDGYPVLKQRSMKKKKEKQPKP